MVVEAARAILPEREDLAGYADEVLRERGIQVLLNTRLESAVGDTSSSPTVSRSTRTRSLWTAGVNRRRSPRSRFPRRPDGPHRTDAYLRVEGLDDAWAAGDAAAIPELRTGQPNPPTRSTGFARASASPRT